MRVGATQFPKLWHLHNEVATTFDWPNVPELYVSQTPFFNAGAYGVDQPFIVLHSAALELLDDDELRVLLSHEMGHVMSGHALYRTIAAILALISLGALPMLAGLAVLPIRLAFLEWSRKSELSADRAGLLGAQDIVVAQRLDMKMAGGGRGQGFAGPAERGRVHAAGARVCRQRRRARRGVQDPQYAGPDPPDAHGARRRAAALGGERRVRPHPARRVHPPRPRDGGAAAQGRPERRRQLLRRRGAGAGQRRWPTPPGARRSGPRDAFRNAQKS